MPSPKPPNPRSRRRRYADRATHGSRPGPSWSADPVAVSGAGAYRWKCPQCPCVANLRGLLRDECSRCGHVHTNPAHQGMGPKE